MFGGVIWTGLVAAGTTVPLVRTHDVMVGDPDPLVNTVTVTASLNWMVTGIRSATL